MKNKAEAVGDADHAPADSLVDGWGPNAKIDQVIPVPQCLLEAHPSDCSDHHQNDRDDPGNTAVFFPDF